MPSITKDGSGNPNNTKGAVATSITQPTAVTGAATAAKATIKVS